MASVIDVETQQSQKNEVRQSAEATGVNLHRLPQHVAIIMDGNGRWARSMKKPRIEGHRAGIKSVREIVRTCRQLDIPYLTLYAFSAENWKRPKNEINSLMILLCTFLKKELREMKDNDIRLDTIGHVDELSFPVQKALNHAKQLTQDGDKMQLTLALSYGGRQEITDAIKKIVQNANNHTLSPDTITPETIDQYLDTADIPDPDLLIRTSGEMRISNFLLWQIAYSEIWITQTLWPDFRKEQLFEALCEYQGRHRRYGGVDIDGAI